MSKIEIDTGKPYLKMLDQIAVALETPVSAIVALSEGRGEKARLPDEFTEDDTDDHAAELAQSAAAFASYPPPTVALRWNC